MWKLENLVLMVAGGLVGLLGLVLSVCLWRRRDAQPMRARGSSWAVIQLMGTNSETNIDGRVDVELVAVGGGRGELERSTRKRTKIGLANVFGTGLSVVLQFGNTGAVLIE